MGELSWLLHDDQLRVYRHYREWEQRPPANEGGQFARIYVLDIGRRWGKTTLRFVIRCEDCLRHPGRTYRYASAYQKNVDEIVNDISRYVLDTAPDDVRPTYGTRRGVGTGFFFPNGSVLLLVGLDQNPDGLRGRASDGDDISEAAFVRHLVSSVKNVLYAQYQGRPWARMCLESSAPLETESDYDTTFLADSQLRQAYAYATIDDNPRLSADERDEFIRAAGGREHPDCQREYFNMRVRDPQRTVVPEFVASKHVVRRAVPQYAYAFTFADPGTRDLFGLVWAYWDWWRQKLVVQRSWAECNAGTTRVASVCADTERELWGGGTDNNVAAPATAPQALLQYWDGQQLRSNPHLRVSDVDLTFITDAKIDHGMTFLPANKARLEEKEAGAARRAGEANLYLLRKAIGDGVIEIWPDSGPLQMQLERGMWNEQRTDFERTPALGHLDCVKALAYGYRKAAMPLRNIDPIKPELPKGDFIHVPKDWGKPEHNNIVDVLRSKRTLRSVVRAR